MLHEIKRNQRGRFFRSGRRAARRRDESARAHGPSALGCRLRFCPLLHSYEASASEGQWPPQQLSEAVSSNIRDEKQTIQGCWIQGERGAECTEY